MSQSQTCSNFLKAFDQYGIRPSLYFKGKMIKGTSFGCFLTSILLLVTIACFFYFGQNLYNRINPLMNHHEEYDSCPEPVILNLEESPILIELNSIDGDNYFTNSSMIIAKVIQIIKIKKDNKIELESRNYNMEICNESHIERLDNVYQEYFRKKTLANFFCIPKNLKNLTMEGGFDQDAFQTIKFSFSICKNNELRNDCLEKDIIKDSMRRGFIGVYFLDIAVDAGNYDQPKKLIPKELFTNFVIDFQKELDIYFQNNFLVSEEGWIFDKIVEEKMVNYDESHELNFMVEDDEFLQVFLKIKQIKSIFGRRYSKIQDLLGLMGGFLNIFYLFGFLLNLLYARLIIITDILLDIFTIKISSSKDVKTPLNLNTVVDNINNVIDSPKTCERQFFRADYHLKELTEIKNKELLINFEDDDCKSAPHLTDLKEMEMDLGKGGEKRANFNITDSIIHQEESNELKEIQILNLSFMDYVYIYSGLFKTPEREQKKLMINKGMEILKKCLDVKYIIQKFYEIEKLKNLLLSDSQLDLFTFLPKPEIIINYNENRNKKIKGPKHSIHTRVLMRSSSFQDLRNNHFTPKENKFVFTKTVVSDSKIRKKLNMYISNTFKS